MACSEPTRTDQLVVCPRCRYWPADTQGCYLCCPADRLNSYFAAQTMPAERAAAYLLQRSGPPDASEDDWSLARRLYREFP